jgi:hypothetical protein
LLTLLGIRLFAQQGACCEARDELSASLTPAALPPAKLLKREQRIAPVALLVFERNWQQMRHSFTSVLANAVIPPELRMKRKSARRLLPS